MYAPTLLGSSSEDTIDLSSSSWLDFKSSVDFTFGEDVKIEKDFVNSPPHYGGKVECIDAIEASLTKEAFRGYLKGNIEKYIWRYENKNELNPKQDLEKAQWYLNRLISTYDGTVTF